MRVSTGPMLLCGLNWTLGADYATYDDDPPFYKVSVDRRGWAANLFGLPSFTPGVSLETMCAVIRATKEDPFYG